MLWYDQQAGEAKKAELEQLAKVTNKIDAASEKFIVSAWDTAYGELPAGKKFALSHWSATPGTEQTSEANQVGNRQLCGDPSGWSSRPSSKSPPHRVPGAQRRIAFDQASTQATLTNFFDVHW